MNTFITNAEDSEELREEIRELLKETGEPYVIEQFKDGYEIMERLTKDTEPMDIAILDIHMPGFNIIDAVKQLWEEWKQTYVIVVSGDDNVDVIIELQNVYHIWGYVIKGKPNSDFGAELKKLVYDAHLRVQHKNRYIERLLREQKQLANGTRGESLD